MIDSGQLAPGSVLQGRWQIEGKLGYGTFSWVYAGVDLLTRTLVALKVPKTHENAALMEDEARILKKLKHCRSVAALIEFSRRPTFIAMERVSDTLLKVSLDEQVSLSDWQTIAVQVLSALEELHSFGVVHGDIKPDNIAMGLSEGRRLYLIDLGLASEVVLNRMHVGYAEGVPFRGSPYFASVHALEGVRASRRDDLESFGYVLLYLLKGSLPWFSVAFSSAGDTTAMLSVRLQTSLSDLCAEAPRALLLYLAYCKGLQFAEKPDYAYLRRLFEEPAVLKGRQQCNSLRKNMLGLCQGTPTPGKIFTKEDDHLRDFESTPVQMPRLDASKLRRFSLSNNSWRLPRTIYLTSLKEAETAKFFWPEVASRKLLRSTNNLSAFFESSAHKGTVCFCSRSDFSVVSRSAAETFGFFPQRETDRYLTYQNYEKWCKDFGLPGYLREPRRQFDEAKRLEIVLEHFKSAEFRIPQQLVDAVSSTVRRVKDRIVDAVRQRLGALEKSIEERIKDASERASALKHAADAVFQQEAQRRSALEDTLRQVKEGLNAPAKSSRYLYDAVLARIAQGSESVTALVFRRKKYDKFDCVHYLRLIEDFSSQCLSEFYLFERVTAVPVSLDFSEQSTYSLSLCDFEGKKLAKSVTAISQETVAKLTPVTMDVNFSCFALTQSLIHEVYMCVGCGMHNKGARRIQKLAMDRRVTPQSIWTELK